MKIEFIEDVSRDVENWQKSLTSRSNYVSDPSKRIPEDVDKERLGDAEYLKQYLFDNFYQTGKVASFKNWLIANTNSAEIQGDIEDLMQRKFKTADITAYITVFGLGRYEPANNVFFVIFTRLEERYKIKISNIYHELMHFLVHEYFWEECKASGLSEAQTHDLKESLTVLLNPILEKRGLPLDEGYPKHQELRAKLKALWEEKNWKFEDFLKKVLELKLVS